MADIQPPSGPSWDEIFAAENATLLREQRLVMGAFWFLLIVYAAVVASLP